ncbi:MAG TPA: NUDIX domain-containing protein [Candidatus Kapabacteria bacterium]|nr:NUDIX domain-containing protein [Candidatus Kapabacteria bacterium]
MNEPVRVAVALLVKDGCVLMGERRPEKIYPLHWEFPGGKLEEGESAIEAVERELREELSIEIQGAEEWFSELATYSNGMTYDISFFLVRSWRGEIVNHEFHNIAWISRDILPTLLHLPGNRRILERLMREGIPT